MEKKKIKWEPAIIAAFIYVCLAMFVTQGDFDSMGTRFGTAILGVFIVGLTALISNYKYLFE